MKRNKGKPMLSSSFKAGFARGFAAPLQFFSPSKIRRPAEFNASVGKAWSDVGQTLRAATKKQGEVIEQKGRHSTKRKQKRSPQAA